jgi:5-formyltetrahydrofolate cyclo-ligase
MFGIATDGSGIDLILMPGSFDFLPANRTLLTLTEGVAFDKSFSRMGYGKGYYDRYLQSYQSKFQRTPALGVPKTLASSYCRVAE